ncbi:D-methionine transport system ATP-binding protein [Paracidovorax wautersii]|uniref:D-methionine transport system ATP-binding protein n=2 Tax=Paracidovorax wautersii TaxID=1177982 RepID=A0ABU1IEC3_9BURK|nr:D-methionine transport system ATP-binding protein [Paracidovorax wautersii]
MAAGRPRAPAPAPARGRGEQALRRARAAPDVFMIDLRGISLTYQAAHGPVEALRGIDLHITPGEVFGIIGRSGAGKSSLVRVINLLNRPTTGQVNVAGRDLTQLSDAQLREARRDIGMVFQHFNLLSSRTVFDNAALPLELAGMDKAAIRERVNPLLELVGLSALANRYPAQISGGQKQRVGIARALASRPKVLLSDEATSALDPETTRSILALLRQVNEELGLTVVLITHQMQVIKQVADRVAVIDAGRIVEQGPVLDVFTRPQQAITKSLIDEIVPQELPASVLDHVRHLAALLPAGETGELLRLSYSGERAYQPILSRLIREHGLDLSILHGQIDEIQRQTFGSLAVYASGEGPRLATAVAQLRAEGVVVDEVKVGG